MRQIGTTTHSQPGALTPGQRRQYDVASWQWAGLAGLGWVQSRSCLVLSGPVEILCLGLPRIAGADRNPACSWRLGLARPILESILVSILVSIFASSGSPGLSHAGIGGLAACLACLACSRLCLSGQSFLLVPYLVLPGPAYSRGPSPTALPVGTAKTHDSRCVHDGRSRRPTHAALPQRDTGETGEPRKRVTNEHEKLN